MTRFKDPYGSEPWLFDIGFDYDDVFYPWYKTAHEISVAAGITNGVEPTTWRPFEEYGCAQEEWWAALEPAIQSGELYRAAPDEHALREVRLLYWIGHRIHFITARGTQNPDTAELIQAHTRQNFEDFGVPHHTLTFEKKKGPAAAKLGLDFFLDDNLKNWLEITEAIGSGSYLLDRPWNQNVVGDTLAAHRLKSVGEFVDIIEKEAANG